MRELPAAFAALRSYPQFLLWRLIERGGEKPAKVPTDPRTLAVVNAHDRAYWVDADTAIAAASAHGLGVAFVLSADDPFFFVDFDDHILPDGSGWSELSTQIAAQFAGAAFEVSTSGRGFHILGQSLPMDHGCKNTPLRLELYTSGRFVALTGINATGDIGTDHTCALAALVADYFLPSAQPAEGSAPDWTDAAVPGWDGIKDDEELIAKALASTSGAAAFGGAATFAQLWHADADALARVYPPAKISEQYDASRADAALAQHLAFWTGGNPARIARLMERSSLRRDKWSREDYMQGTVLRACGLQRTYHGMRVDTPVPAANLPELVANTDKQRSYADTVRARALATATPEQATVLTAPTGAPTLASFWLDNQDRTPEQLVAKLAPITEAAPPARNLSTAPVVVSGFQYLTGELQQAHFAGCVYVKALHRVLTPDGGLLDPKQFKAVYGGYTFQMTDAGTKDSRNAWEAFTESQIVRWPRADSLCFRPDLPTGALIERDQQIQANCYVAIHPERKPGDVSRFLQHLAKVLPNEHDQQILLSYMAACVQYKGVKFQWAPLLQGTEGNGKTLFTRCVAAAIGRRYTHFPKAADIDNKFNGWLLNKLFIGVEDIYVPDHKREVIETLKPMITGGDGLEIQFKGADQITADICANFILNSNHKDAIRKTESDRRFCVFYTAQQCSADLARDGMTGSYFPDLYEWLRAGGYAAVTDYLLSYAIPDALNPATLCHRAPETSSTAEVIVASMGSVEQEILEAVAEGRPGFAGGWISSVALDQLLNQRQLGRKVPHNKRRELLQSMGYDWHPALYEGRVNNPTLIDGGKKPRLFVRTDSLLRQFTGPAEVADRYQRDQGAGALLSAGPTATAGAA